MEKIDRKILELLQADADVTNALLAKQVHLSPSSCLRRVQKLKQQGVIARTVALLDQEKLGRDLTAIVDVVLERHGADDQRDFVRAVKDEPAIAQAFLVTGDVDVVLLMTLTGMREYQSLCDRLFHHDRNVLRYRTLFSMDHFKNETALPVPA
jgi:DNA-binding Lrp family transcriptional regulator